MLDVAKEKANSMQLTISHVCMVPGAYDMPIIVDRLFKSYFQEGRDISEKSVLTRIASAAGMNQDVVRRLLESDADVDDIRARDTDARKKGIQGVPAFVVANEYVVQGAQNTDVWDNIIKEIQEVTKFDG